MSLPKDTQDPIKKAEKLPMKLKSLINLGAKHMVPFFISICIVCLSWYLLYSHYTHAHLSHDFITILESKLLDMRFRARGVEKPKSKIAILAIDEKAIRQFGRWPFSRRFYPQALKNIKKLGVKWIGFDAIFSESEKSSLQDATPYLKKVSAYSKSSKRKKHDLQKALDHIHHMNTVSPGDKLFAEGIKDIESVVLGYFYFLNKEEVESAGMKDNPFLGLEDMSESSIQAVLLPEEKKLSDYSSLLQARGIVANTNFITKNGKHFAFFSNEGDEDAMMRWITLVKIMDHSLMPSLSLKMASEIMNRDILAEFDSFSLSSLELVSRDNDSDTIKIPLDPIGQGRLLIKHYGPSATFPHISLADAYHNSFTEDQKKYLKDASLLVGMTAIGINDQRPNPFDATLDGVENHAAALDNILNKNFMKRPKSIYNLELLIIFLIGLLFTPIIILSSASLSGFLAASFLIGYYYFDRYYWFSKGIWAYIGMPFIEIISLFIIITLYKYITEERERKKVKGAFSLYLSPEVIHQVLEDPKLLKLGGERKELTVFFSDVRNFTSISEGLTSETLCSFMNEYFTPMTGIILESKGVLDKYIGDAIMAFWGAPLFLEDQADRAVDASIKMLYALEKLQKIFREKGFPECNIGIGLNTGLMSVGNMGSAERFCYTVMGDSVNLSSRLEGLTKKYDTKILASEFTIAKLTKSHHIYRELDLIRVKGKKEPIKIYDFLRPDDIPSKKEREEFLKLFSEGRHFYLLQDWENALQKFQDCLKIRKGDGPSSVFIARIQEFSQNPKIPDWDGVYTFKNK